MAFNLLVELPQNNPDWTSISLKMATYASKGIECFPIAQYGPKEENYLGLSFIFLREEFDQDRIDAFVDAILYFLKEGSQVFELYAGTQLSTENVHALMNDFLS